MTSLFEEVPVSVGDEVPRRRVELTLNGERRAADVEPRLLLAHLIRNGFQLTGTHTGCDTTNCGACTVLFDGQPVKSCTMFAVQANGHEVTTVEELTFWELEEYLVEQEIPFIVQNLVTVSDIQQELYSVPVVERTTHSHPVLHGLGDAERAGLEVTNETVEVLIGADA